MRTLIDSNYVYLPIIAVIIAFCLGLVVYPALCAFRSIGANNQYLVEIKLSIFGVSVSYTLYNPIWNYERLKKTNPEGEQ